MNGLKGDGCRVYSTNLRVGAPASGLATYPDAPVVCGALLRDPESLTHVVNPCVIVEVLSPATEAYDRKEERDHYRSIPRSASTCSWRRASGWWLDASSPPRG